MVDLREKVSKEEVLAAIPTSKGLIEPIEKELLCTRKAVKQILNEHPEVKEALEEELEREKDRIEFNLMRDAKNGDPKARELFMKSRMRERHYGERLEVTGAEGAPLVFLHTSPADLSIETWAKNAQDYDAKQAAALDAELFEKAKEMNSQNPVEVLPEPEDETPAVHRKTVKRPGRQTVKKLKK